MADEVELQRDQFLRVNSAKPLPHGLITELLPEVGTSLPANLSARRIPSAICDWLNSEKTSPFFGLIRRASTSEEQKAKTVVTDTSVVKMIEESLTSPAGCLFPYRNIATGETDFDGICKVLVTYWTAVSRVFPEAWGKPPSSQPAHARRRNPRRRAHHGPRHARHQASTGQCGGSGGGGDSADRPLVPLDGRKMGGSWRSQLERDPECAAAYPAALEPADRAYLEAKGNS